MSEEKGQISIHSKNILPIIKKWLYAEKDIFLRELVSNSSDAIHKLNKLNMLGETEGEIPEAKISIDIDKPGKKISISDTGLGMTGEEIKKYIAQVAFSGLEDYVAAYKGKGDEEQIIGHFGLGFYSSFMVADHVEVESLSYKKDAKAAKWVCEGEEDYTLSEGTRTTVGTTITLHINEDNLDLLDVFKIKEICERYCGFLKYPVYVQGDLSNETSPVWTKSPTILTDEDYKSFFHKMFPGNPDPLFWIHLNVDHPFHLKGILYFPKLSHELEASQGQVKLFCNQVYVEDNCKELIPDYLTLLKGVIDCPDLPLNVSRSALQADQTVKQISKHITKKVSDKLTGLFKTDRPAYEKFWDDISSFVKYGMMRDRDFADRLLPVALWTTADKRHLTGDEYLKANETKTDNKIVYATNPSTQTAYIKMAKETGIDVVICNSMIDKHFLPFVEMHSSKKYSFTRVDASESRMLKGGSKSEIVVDSASQKTQSQLISELFSKHLSSQPVEIKVDAFQSESVPALLVVDEDKRRMQEFLKMGLFQGDMPDLQGIGNEKSTLMVNERSPAVKNLLKLSQSFQKDDELDLGIQQIYDLARLQQEGLSPEEMSGFLERSASLLAKLGSVGGASNT